jgi:hypothetical protein
VHELLADKIAFLAGEGGQCAYLVGDALLLRERQLNRLRRLGERRLRGLDTRDRDLVIRIEEVLDEHHRVVPLLHRLAVEVRGQQRERLRVVVHGDRHVLLRRGELVPDLLVHHLGEPGHGATLTGPADRTVFTTSTN